MHRPLRQPAALLAALAATSALGLVSAPQAHAVATIKSSVTSAIAGESITITGTLPPKRTRTVILQRNNGSGWTNALTGNTTTTGAFTFTTKAHSATTNYRVTAPAAKINGRRHPAATTGSRKITPLTQRVLLDFRPTAHVGESVGAQADVQPVRRGRRVTLQRYDGKTWVTVAQSTQDEKGAAAFEFRAPAPGTTSYRALVASAKGASSHASATRPLTTTTAPVRGKCGALVGDCEALADLVAANPHSPLPPVLKCPSNYVNCDGDHRVIDLYLGRQDLTTIPDSLGNLTGLQHLGLHLNRITELPESIGNLTNLTNLSVAYNQLTALPASIGELTRLTEIWIDGNPLRALPPGIGNLTKVTELQLTFTNLTALPESIGNLTNLTTLNLFESDLTALPDSIGNLTNLTSLSVAYNQLSGDISAWVAPFAQRRQDVTVDLDGNSCLHVGDDTLLQTWVDTATGGTTWRSWRLYPVC